MSCYLNLVLVLLNFWRKHPFVKRKVLLSRISNLFFTLRVFFVGLASVWINGSIFMSIILIALQKYSFL